MSRTLKDLRSQKALRKEKVPELIKASYRKAKKCGLIPRLNEEDFCPDCGGLTSFQDGFLTCEECSWSTFETEELCFGNFEFKPAI